MSPASGSSAPHGGTPVSRVARRTALVCGALAIGALMLWPQRPRVALGVAGGGVLAGLAFWALVGAAAALGDAEKGQQNRAISRRFHLVKFFTRHVILAAVAYVMMVRLHLDPVGMLVGVTSVVIAAACEAVRPK
jgi:hypothetical protein